MGLYERYEKRDPEEVLPKTLPAPIEYRSHRKFVREVLSKEANLRARGTEFVRPEDESEETRRYRERLNHGGAPSQSVAAGYRWQPGSEVAGLAERHKGDVYKGRASHVEE
jgi:hypothetical protein